MKNDYIKNASSFELHVAPSDAGTRIDQFIAQHFAHYSRSFLQKLFKQGTISVQGKKEVKPGYALREGDVIIITFPEEKKPEEQRKQLATSQLPVAIIAQEKDFLIVDKPAGLVVHAPNQNFQEATLSDWVVSTHDDIAHVGLIDRPGIVHRLDKDTSGLMIIARTNHGHATLTGMFKDRKISKTYLAIVMGHPPARGTIDYFVGRHPTVRNKMHHFTDFTKKPTSRSAQTHYEVIKFYKDFSLVKAMPVTGRTHQIRVHFAAIGHPLLADSVYGNKSKLLKRHGLHAHQLAFEFEGTAYEFTSPLASDLQAVLDKAE